jgi:hypothetical protein
MLKRTQWAERKRRFRKRMESFATPLNDLGHDDRTSRVMCLMHNAYDMGREDQRLVTKRRAGLKPKRAADAAVDKAMRELARRLEPAVKLAVAQMTRRLRGLRVRIG